MTIAEELHAPLIVLALAQERLSKRGGHEDICTQIKAALDHIEDVRQSLQAMEEHAARPRTATVLPHELPQRDPSLAELDGAVIVSLHEARMVRRGLVQP